jgi:hypothetical protein
MKNFFKNSCTLVITCMLVSCGDSDGGFTGTGSSGGGGTATTNIISEKNLYLTYEDPIFTVISSEGEFKQVTGKVTVFVADRNNIKITGSHTVAFRTEWGFFDQDFCVTSNGSCSVTWTSGSPQELASDRRVLFSAYTLGEEEFVDTNGNGFFDDPDGFVAGSNDLEEPYIDCNHDLAYTAGEQIIDVHTINGIHDAEDTLNSTPDCQDTTGRCSPSPTIMIYHKDYVFISGEDVLTVPSPIYGIGSPLYGLLTSDTCTN